MVFEVLLPVVGVVVAVASALPVHLVGMVVDVLLSDPL